MRLIETLPRTLTGASRAGAVCVFLAVLLAAIAGPSSDAVAQARIACGSFYRVAPGDTLHRIATRAYGSGNYQAIFEANRDILPNISRISVGDELLIPCLDGTGPKTRREALALGIGTGAGTGTGGGTPAPEASATAIRPAGGGIGFLTGSDFAPFAHRALPEGGMITELVRLAIARAAPEREVNVTFVDDWSAHLGLLDQGAYDLGFPWYRPDCSKADRLSASMRQRCTGFEFSDPLFEVAIGYYVRAGDPLAGATAYDRLFGRKLCRPAGYFTFDLDQEDLREPNATRIIPPAAADCFTWLMRGEVDVVTLNKSLATAEISKLGLDRRVAEIPALASAQTLHVVAPKGDAEGRAYLDLVNQGLADLQASGRWFEVVSRHLGAFGVWLR
ncbi:MAG: transporter substrate-binding domain-containing protein [Alphaproteobacteria bacterium]